MNEIKKHYKLYDVYLYRECIIKVKASKERKAINAVNKNVYLYDKSTREQQEMSHFLIKNIIPITTSAYVIKKKNSIFTVALMSIYLIEVSKLEKDGVGQLAEISVKEAKRDFLQVEKIKSIKRIKSQILCVTKGRR